MKHGSTNQPQIKQSVEPEFVSVEQAETMSGLSRWTWRRFAYDGKIASTKVGRRLLVPVSEVRRVLMAGYRPPLADGE